MCPQNIYFFLSYSFKFFDISTLGSWDNHNIKSNFFGVDHCLPVNNVQNTQEQWMVAKLKNFALAALNC